MIQIEQNKKQVLKYFVFKIQLFFIHSFFKKWAILTYQQKSQINSKAGNVYADFYNKHS